MGYGKMLDLVKGSKISDVVTSLTVAISAFLLSLLGCLLYNFWADAAAQVSPEGADLPLALSPSDYATAVIYLLVLLLGGVALLLIIRTVFVASMQNRVHQLGLLASVGATPRQLKALLFRDGMRLSIVPICLGTALGAFVAFVILSHVMSVSRQLGLRAEDSVAFTLHPLVIVAILLLVFVTVAVSVNAPARRMSKTTPLNAIGGVFEKPNAKKARKRSLLGALFGIEGELESQSLRQRRSSLRAATLSMGMSFVVLGLFLSFMTASTISVNETYYERYGTAWDYAIDFPSASPEALGVVASAFEHKGWHVVQDGSDKGLRLYVEADDEASPMEITQETSRATTLEFEVTDMESDKRRSEEIWRGYTLLVGGICGILALIGISGIAAQAISSNHQRRREFARLKSVGLEPKGVRKMLGIEALAVVGRPLAVAIPLVVLIAIGLMSLSRNTPAKFLASFPFGVVVLYIACVLLIVALAYGIGARKIVRDDIAKALRDDSML